MTVKFSYYKQPIPIALITVVLTLLSTIFGVYLIRQHNIALSKLSTQELIATIAVIFSGVNILFQVTMKTIDMMLSKKTRMELNIGVTNRHVKISCGFDCLGQRRVIPKNIYLFIEKGRKNSRGLFEFPYLLQHEQGECDCVLSKRCKQGGITTFPIDLYPDDFQADFAPIVITLKHLSSQSILFMDPGEYFCEDISIELDAPGVYRATLVFTATNADCMCSTRQFLIEEKAFAENSDYKKDSAEVVMA